MAWITTIRGDIDYNSNHLQDYYVLESTCYSQNDVSLTSDTNLSFERHEVSEIYEAHNVLYSALHDYICYDDYQDIDNWYKWFDNIWPIGYRCSTISVIFYGDGQRYELDSIESICL